MDGKIKPFRKKKKKKSVNYYRMIRKDFDLEIVPTSLIHLLDPIFFSRFTSG